MAGPDIKVFISYAHKDLVFFEVFRNGLISHLYTSSEFNFGVWEDSQIHTGSFWDEEIQKNLGNSGIAILCISANFLNSEYIRAAEFGLLVKKFPDTLIVPVYFNHCNINAWDELSQRQFFKPGGGRYRRATDIDFAFCDLIRFNESDGKLISNSDIDRYCQDLTRKIEDTLRIKYPLPGNSVNPNPENASPVAGGKEPAINLRLPGTTLIDKIVYSLVLIVMVASACGIFYFLFEKTIADANFKSIICCVIFFGTTALHFYNKNNKKLQPSI